MCGVFVIPQDFSFSHKNKANNKRWGPYIQTDCAKRPRDGETRKHSNAFPSNEFLVDTTGVLHAIKG